VIGNIDRFHNYRQFRSYMGWFPKLKQSGTSLNTSHLAPDGVRLGRYVFGFMAMTLMSPTVPETPFRIHYERLLARGMKPMTAIGNVAGKLTAVLYSCLKTGTPYDQTKHRQELGLPAGQDLPAKPPMKTPEPQLPTVDL
jgi:transposase